MGRFLVTLAQLLSVRVDESIAFLEDGVGDEIVSLPWSNVDPWPLNSHLCPLDVATAAVYTRKPRSLAREIS